MTAVEKQLTDSIAHQQEKREQEDLEAELRAAFEGQDIGPTAQSRHEQDLHRYLSRIQWLKSRRTLLQQQRQYIDAMEAEIDRKLQGHNYLFQQVAIEACRNLLKGKTKSVKTPFGVAGFRSKAKLLVIEDQSLVVAAWSSFTLPQECVKKIEKEPEFRLVKAELDKLFETTGEIPPGCTVQLAREEFYVK